jgi:hypothetical protein
MARNKKKKTISPWDDHVQEAQNLLIESQSKFDSKTKIIRVLLYLAIPAALISSLSAISSYGALAAKDPVQQISSYDINNIYGKDLAMQRLSKWLSTPPQPLASGRILSWDGAEQEGELPSTTQGVGNTETTSGEIYAHHFTLEDESGNTYTTVIKTLYVPSKGSFILTEPTLLPVFKGQSGEGSGVPLWGNIPSFGATKAISNIVKQWGEGYMGGDEQRLKITIGDPDATHAYLTMPPMTHITTKINQCGSFAAEGEGDQAVTTQAICNVSVLYQNPDAPKPSSSSDAASVAYDLLILDANLGSPKVVAWGASGEGLKLTPYQNAVVDSEEAE